MAKESEFSVKVDADLRDAFMAEAEASHRPASQIVGDLMREFVQRQRAARDHDAWFRAKVQESLDDPRPSIPHEHAMAELDALLDRIAAKAKR